MKRYLLKILLNTVGISLTITTILIRLIILRDAGGEHDCDDISGIVYGIGWFIIILMAITNTSIFLNLIEKIRANYFYSFLSFIFLPATVVFINIYLFLVAAEELVFYLVIAGPYLSIMLFHYFRSIIKWKRIYYKNFAV